MNEQLVFTAIGTVKDFMGANGALGFQKNNIAKSEVNIVLHLKDNNGGVHKAFLSPTLTQMIRAKQIGIGHLGTMLLSKSSNGNLNIHRPQEEVTWIEAKKLQIREITPVVLQMEDLIAL